MIMSFLALVVLGGIGVSGVRLDEKSGVRSLVQLHGALSADALADAHLFSNTTSTEWINPASVVDWTGFPHPGYHVGERRDADIEGYQSPRNLIDDNGDTFWNAHGSSASGGKWMVVLDLGVEHAATATTGFRFRSWNGNYQKGTNRSTDSKSGCTSDHCKFPKMWIEPTMLNGTRNGIQTLCTFSSGIVMGYSTCAGTNFEAGTSRYWKVTWDGWGGSWRRNKWQKYPADVQFEAPSVATLPPTAAPPTTAPPTTAPHWPHAHVPHVHWPHAHVPHIHVPH